MKKLQYLALQKARIKNLLYEYLYAPILEEFSQIIKKTAQQNNAPTGQSNTSFQYMSLRYFKSGAKMPYCGAQDLRGELIESFDRYLEQINHINRHEVPQVLEFISETLHSSDSLLDYFEILPVAIHEPLRQLISTCPCRNSQLTDEQVHDLKNRNTKSIELLKRRIKQNAITHNMKVS